MVEFIQVKKYDALKGRPVREVKANDIVHISAKYSSHSAGTLVFTALSSTEEVYITGFGVSAGAGGVEIGVTVNTATILPITLGGAGETHLITEREAPFYKASANSTISIFQSTAATTAAWLCGVREPTFEKIEVL